MYIDRELLLSVLIYPKFVFVFLIVGTHPSSYNNVFHFRDFERYMVGMHAL